MAASCTSALAATLSSLAVSSACAPSASGSHWKPALAPFAGHGIVLSNAGFSNVRIAVRRTVSIVKNAAGDVIQEAAAEVPAITTMLSEAELLKRKAKKAELRRKRLVRKRKLRKKGKWPPSKMAKLKNV